MKQIMNVLLLCISGMVGGGLFEAINSTVEGQDAKKGEDSCKPEKDTVEEVRTRKLVVIDKDGNEIVIGGDSLTITITDKDKSELILGNMDGAWGMSCKYEGKKRFGIATFKHATGLTITGDSGHKAFEAFGSAKSCDPARNTCL